MTMRLAALALPCVWLAALAPRYDAVLVVHERVATHDAVLVGHERVTSHDAVLVVHERVTIHHDGVTS